MLLAIKMNIREQLKRADVHFSSTQKKFIRKLLDREKQKAELAESKGAVKALKWVLFIHSYKPTSLVKREMEKFIAEEIKKFPELSKEDHY